MMLKTGLKDLGFKGSKFTWTNNRKGFSYVAARSDRALANQQWISSFMDPYGQRFAQIIAPNFRLCPTTPMKAPFMFDDAWLHHPELLDVVQDEPLITGPLIQVLLS